MANEPLEIYGDGQQSRCFCDVSDVTDALITLSESEQAQGEVFNVGSDHEITINDLADLVIEVTGSQSEKRFVPFEAVFGPKFEETRRRVPDLTKIRQTIGYEPKIALEETIMRIIRHIQLAGSRRSAELSHDEGTPFHFHAKRAETLGASCN